MRAQSILTFAFAAFAVPSLADDPLDFVVSLFPTNLECAGNGATPVFGTGCVNHVLPQNGSALVRQSVSSPNGYVTGWSKEGCTGTALVVFTKLDGCTKFPDVEVKSWIGKAPFE